MNYKTMASKNSLSFGLVQCFKSGYVLADIMGLFFQSKSKNVYSQSFYTVIGCLSDKIVGFKCCVFMYLEICVTLPFYINFI